ncbi:MAG: TonB-dependent receptor [Bacteroidales bacterium]|jgi:iron complex outermembrane receptor protein|nr:TonB-dependent receptor [Bacteroidales bacterium]
MKRFFLFIFSALFFSNILLSQTYVDTFIPDSSLNVLDEIVVSASRFGNLPNFSTSLNKTDFEKHIGLQDITQMLQLSLSVVSTSEAGTGIGATNFRVRGIDPTRINITVNGIPINDPESQSVFWNNMPDFVSSVSSMNLTRGVGTSSNGSAAFGASLNILTNSLNPNPYAEIGFWAGSFNSFKEHVLAGTGLLKGGFSFDVQLSKINSDGYVRNGFSDHKSFSINASWRNEKNLVRANVIYGNQKTGITWNGCSQEILFDENLSENFRRTYNDAGQYYNEYGDTLFYNDDTDNYKQTHYLLSYSRIINSKLDLNFALHYTRGDGYYEDYKLGRKLKNYGLQNFVTTDGRTISKTDLIQQKWMGNNYYGGTFSLNYNLKKIKIAGGGDISQYDGEHFGNILWIKDVPVEKKGYEWYRNNGLKNDMNIFAKINYEISNNFNLFGDLQYRYIEYKMSGIDDDLASLNQNHYFHFINPKAGLSYLISTNHQLYFTFANTHREPTRTNFKDANSSPEKMPKTESLFDYELGYIFQSSKFSANANLYFMDYYNQLVPTGELSASGYDIMTNVARSYRAGIELSVAYKPIKQLEIKANATFSQNKIKNFILTSIDSDIDWNETSVTFDLGQTNLAYSPNIIASGIITYHIIKGLNISIISKYVGEQYFDNTSSDNRKLDDYWINNFQIDYSLVLPKIMKEIDFTININNFTNRKYCNDAIGGVWYEIGEQKQWANYFPQAGINFMGGIVLKF